MMRRILAVCLLLFVVHASPVSAGAKGFLRTQGQDMVDEDGNKVLLRGVGLGNWLLPEGYMWKFGDGGDRPRKIEKIVAYSRGRDKPPAEVAQRAFDELIENIKLENCVYFPDLVNAMFRCVPGKVEAEDYGHGGCQQGKRVFRLA